jgi:hypothetical protein
LFGISRLRTLTRCPIVQGIGFSSIILRSEVTAAFLRSFKGLALMKRMELKMDREEAV